MRKHHKPLPTMHQLAFFAPLEVIPEPPPYPEQPSRIIVSVSGGLDSDYVALWARERWPNAPIILWHAHLPDMDWTETPDHLRALAQQIGNATVIIAQAVYALSGRMTPTGMNGTTLRRVHIVEDGDGYYGPNVDDDPDILHNLIDFARRARLGQAPTNKLRWCTSYFKTRLFERWAMERRAWLGDTSVLLSGERWAESPRRAQLPAWEWRDDITLKPCAEWPIGWRMVWARPGIALRACDVAQYVLRSGLAPHVAYFAQGETLATLTDPQLDERGRARCSCKVCIFTLHTHIATALINRPQSMQPAVDMVRAYEHDTGYSWQQRGTLVPVPERP